ncbi:MAG TPA: hypothetical protein PKE29_13935 [Phycisphaerales bacterium]|nr:hypothetical protein [Phycisphaerales bacterium]
MLKFGWPFIIAIVAAGAYVPNRSGVAVLIGLVFVIAVLMNTPIQLNLLIRKHIPSHLRPSWVKGVMVLGRITYVTVGVITLLTIISPLLLLAACLFMR